MKNLRKRLEIVEREVGTCVVPEKERIIVIPYPADQEQEFERLTHESIKRLKEKYGPNISEDDLFVIGIRKFCSTQLSSDDAAPKAGGARRNKPAGDGMP